MPKLDITMPPEQVTGFLREQPTMILATNGKNGHPHLAPMWHIMDGEQVYFTTYRSSQKVKNVLRDNRVTCLVERGYGYYELQGVMLIGRCHLVEDPAEQERLIERLRQRAHARGVEPEAHAGQEKAHREGKRLFLRLDVERVVSWDFTKIPRPAKGATGT